MTIMWFTGRS